MTTPCPLCPPRLPEHDRTDYGSGDALRSGTVMMLLEAGASDEQVAAITRALTQSGRAASDRPRPGSSEVSR